MTVRILCVDDDKDGCDMVCVFLNAYNPSFTVEPVYAMSDATAAVATGGFDVYLFDNWLADKSGLDLCREIRITDKTTPIILYSAAAHLSDVEAGLEAGADAYLIKPGDLLNLGPTIDRLLVQKAGQVGMVP